MKVILYMAMSANGMIAKGDDETPWSNEEWESFAAAAKEVGSLIVGHRTHQLMLDDHSYEKLGYPFTVVLTHDTHKIAGTTTISSATTPMEALQKISGVGFDKVLLGGGAQTNSSFIPLNLIDEVILDIEPLIFGKGIPLFAPGDFEASLELVETKMLNKNTIQLHYKVTK